MKNLKRQLVLAIGIMTATLISVTAQNFQGIATYQSSRKMNGFSIKSDQMTPAMQAQIEEQMKKQFQKEYELKFNLKESIWSEVESLDGGPATASAGGLVIRMAGGGSTTYKNTSENLYLKETEVFSKPFLVNDTLSKREWELTDETKTIGNYQAYKAVFTDVRESRTISFNSQSDGEKTDEEVVPEVKMDTIKIEAWYTPQIPVSQGPDEYWGLPGLILEVSDGKMSYACTKVILNPEEEVKIKRPSKGKKVTRTELREEIDAKTAEMTEKFSNGKGGISIKVGGN
ncbi:MAG: GLPGLI family protein [Roseivirga sp.]|jgi:GLPGLI family protein|uniref:GLPGLI family protein n=1 Tax=Roseivirga sp. TaxID=1964215 RepID=UPI001B02E666|nr:GLPGLI family protein [Roseivirga sp.]MBO6497603.1 GLPGLI family protein [Roseivirga sp.]